MSSSIVVWIDVRSWESIMAMSSVVRKDWRNCMNAAGDVATLRFALVYAVRLSRTSCSTTPNASILTASLLSSIKMLVCTGAMSLRLLSLAMVSIEHRTDTAKRC